MISEGNISKVRTRYVVGQVDVEVNHSHQNKLRILHMTMHNWEKNNGEVPMDSRMGRMYESDLHKVEELVEEGREILTKEEMLDMNVIFKSYGGQRLGSVISTK
ncbi:hypothetical protein HN615_07220 [Candidatus Woesearchaeota archaeon]|jgi:hypothetical protein|nr:hypothetical protein [Candidatus Woesearchaeota archaeon]